ncbi:hepatic lectin-like isoform X2 [Pseudophryne corroboree]|uniref:hepatic lectin-like isoform X2 n=1 Tax=Pseudophryne corroboree TaxID=495146 RepID=UPI003081F3C3
MDSDWTTSRDSDFKYSASGWRYFCGKKPEWITYGLLMLLYVLILALVITVFCGSTTSSTSQTVSKAELDGFNKTEKSCDPGWLQFDGSCYYLTLSKSNWNKSRSVCIKKGADLAVITSEREQNFLTTKSAANYGKRFWIGLHDAIEEGVWIWVDGTNYEASYTSWKEGEPNDHFGDEDCVHLWTAGEWNDVYCTYDDSYAICEKKL